MSKVILALSFGKPADIKPNKFIARLAKWASKEEIPIAADKCIPLEKSELVHWIGPEAEVHAPTLQLAEEFVNLCIEYEWDEVTLITKPDLYFERCYIDIMSVAEEKGAHLEFFFFQGYDWLNWYDKRSTQWWIRGEWLFFLREAILVRGLCPRWLYEYLSKRKMGKAK